MRGVPIGLARRAVDHAAHAAAPENHRVGPLDGLDPLDVVQVAEVLDVVADAVDEEVGGRAVAAQNRRVAIALALADAHARHVADDVGHALHALVGNHRLRDDRDRLGHVPERRQRLRRRQRGAGGIGQAGSDFDVLGHRPHVDRVGVRSSQPRRQAGAGEQALERLLELRRRPRRPATEVLGPWRASDGDTESVTPVTASKALERGVQWPGRDAEPEDGFGVGRGRRVDGGGFDTADSRNAEQKEPEEDLSRTEPNHARFHGVKVRPNLTSAHEDNSDQFGRSSPNSQTPRSRRPTSCLMPPDACGTRNFPAGSVRTVSKTSGCCGAPYSRCFF